MKSFFVFLFFIAFLFLPNLEAQNRCRNLFQGEALIEFQSFQEVKEAVKEINSRKTIGKERFAQINRSLIEKYLSLRGRPLTGSDKKMAQYLQNQIIQINEFLVKIVLYGDFKNKSDYLKEDLFQVGMFGLYRALEKYEPDGGGAGFITYAKTVIRNSMVDELSNSALLAVDDKTKKDFQLMQKVRLFLRDRDHTEPSDYEISHYIQNEMIHESLLWGDVVVFRGKKRISGHSAFEEFTVTYIQTLPNIYKEGISDTVHFDDGYEKNETSRFEQMELEQPSQEEMKQVEQNSHATKLAINELKSKEERIILSARYQLDKVNGSRNKELGDHPTYEDIGQILVNQATGQQGLSAERVRQIEKRAIKKLQQRLSPEEPSVQTVEWVETKAMSQGEKVVPWVEVDKSKDPSPMSTSQVKESAPNTVEQKTDFIFKKNISNRDISAFYEKYKSHLLSMVLSIRFFEELSVDQNIFLKAFLLRMFALGTNLYEFNLDARKVHSQVAKDFKKNGWEIINLTQMLNTWRRKALITLEQDGIPNGKREWVQLSLSDPSVISVAIRGLKPFEDLSQRDLKDVQQALVLIFDIQHGGRFPNLNFNSIYDQLAQREGLGSTRFSRDQFHQVLSWVLKELNTKVDSFRHP